MPIRTIHTQENGTTVRFDDEDRGLPIEVGHGDYRLWVSPEAVAAAQKAISGSAAPNAPYEARAADISLNEALLRLAIVHERTVEFRYAKGSGQNIELRRLAPGDLKEVKGHLTFTGYDPDRDDVRAYRLDRVRGDGDIRFV